MTVKAVKALHSNISGIFDVRAGYETLKERAEPKILPTVRGLVNKAANVVRDTFGDLDRGALSFVRHGEEQLLPVYGAALEDWPIGEAPAAREVAHRQASGVRTRIAGLPES